MYCLRIVFSLLMLLPIFIGCGGEVREVELKKVVDGDVVDEFLSEVDVLSGEMEEIFRLGADVGALRGRIEKIQSRQVRVVKSLQDFRLSLSEEEWRLKCDEKSGRIAQSLDRFARAEMRLREKLSEAQRVELHEVLNGLQ